MDSKTFQELWQLLQPSMTFGTRGRYEKCLSYWNAMDEAQRNRIYQHIAAKKQQGQYVNPNPCFAINDAMQEDEYARAKAAAKAGPQILSFDEYYARYGTTEEKDGWTKKFLPEERKTIYVKE